MEVIEFKIGSDGGFYVKSVPHRNIDYAGRYVRESDRMVCSGCGSRPITAVLAVLNGKTACCPDCDTLTVKERNQIRNFYPEALLERHRRLVALCNDLLDAPHIEGRLYRGLIYTPVNPNTLKSIRSALAEEE